MDKEYFAVKIDLPSFQIELKSKDPSVTLPELRKVLEAVRLDEQFIYEEFVQQELHTIFSSSFTNNMQVMEAVKKLLKKEEDYRVFKATLMSTTSIDLDQQTENTSVTRKEVRKTIGRIAQSVQINEVKQGIVHISGTLADNDKLLIVDHIHKHMPTAQLRAFHSTSEGQDVSVECIFFGDFEDE